MRIIRFAISLLIILAVMAGNMGYAVNADNTDSVSDQIEKFCRDTKCNSVSVAVISGGSVSCYGDTSGLYQIGSMTKAFTGLAIQKLIGEGKIRLEDALSDHLPGYTACFGGAPYEITIDQLLTQASGYTNSESEYPSADKDMSLQEWAYSMSGKELRSVPGADYSYSNVNYNLLGAVIERISGRSYKDYMEKEILIPLGLTHTYVTADRNKERVVPGSRLGYRKAFRYEIPISEGKIPAGYFYSNAEDMARWIRIWLGREDIPEEFRNCIAEVKKNLNKEGDYYSGWEMTGSGDTGHSGGTPNYSSRIVFSDTKQAGVCVLTNLNVAASTDSLCNGLFSLVSNGSKAAIQKDVWTVFDIIFTAVSAAGILLAVFIFRIRKRRALLITGIILSVLIISVLAVMSAVFGAGLKEIFCVWAPLSISGGMIMLSADLVFTGARALIVRKNEVREKTG